VSVVVTVCGVNIPEGVTSVNKISGIFERFEGTLIHQFAEALKR